MLFAIPTRGISTYMCFDFHMDKVAGIVDNETRQPEPSLSAMHDRAKSQSIYIRHAESCPETKFVLTNT